MIASVDAIAEFVSGMDAKTYLGDRKTQSAVERELLIISEACARLLDLDAARAGESLERRFPKTPWHKIRGIGNVLRHEYGAVAPARIWDLVALTSDLAELRKTLLLALPRLSHPVTPSEGA